MKTTIEIADPLLDEVRERARAQGTTLRSVIERALRRELREPPRECYVLPDLSVGGGWLRPEFDTWEKVRAAIYALPEE